MIAEVTYNGGKSYRIRTFRFLQGVTTVVDDPEVIQRCRATVGFAVEIKREKRKAKKVAVPRKKIREPIGAAVKPKSRLV